eukprot:8417852-Karenia_brevis.AAC.1
MEVPRTLCGPLLRRTSAETDFCREAVLSKTFLPKRFSGNGFCRNGLLPKRFSAEVMMMMMMKMTMMMMTMMMMMV